MLGQLEILSNKPRERAEPLQLQQNRTCAAVSMFSPHIVADNDDLLREILIRLPVDSLLRFKLVSKHWLSLITDQRFCLNKSQILCKHISGLFLHRTSFYPDQVYDFIPLPDEDKDDNTPRTPPFRTLPFVPDHHHHLPSTKLLNILRSCNGLLLCRSSCLEQGAIKYNYYIFNPTTRKFTPTNPDPLYPARQSVRAVYLAFDPRKSANYKAIWIYVSISNSNSNSTVAVHGLEIGIYSSSSGIWKWCRRNSDRADSTAQTNLETGVYWNGGINWTSNRGNGLYFNVDEERFGTLPMPEVPEIRAEERRIRYFGESNDHLHLIETTCPLATRFNVYEMMDKEYSGWIVKYQVDMEQVMMKPAMTELNVNNRSSYHHSFQFYKFAIIDLVRRQKEEDSFLVFSIPGMAVRYNFTDKSVNKVLDFDPNHLLGGLPMIGCYDSFRFIYSLIPLI